MSRSFIALAVLALAAPVIYQWTPEIIEWFEGGADRARSATQVLLGDKAEAAVDPALSASIAHYDMKVIAAKPTAEALPARRALEPTKKAMTPKTQTFKRRSAARNSRAHLPAAPHFVTHKSAPTPQKKIAQQEAMLPMANDVTLKSNRWIAGLSGKRFDATLMRRTIDTNCRPSQDNNCERVTPKDLSLVGVVVDSDRAANTGALLDGEVRRGHYLRGTPAVYVK
jgi:hypothetical protein